MTISHDAENHVTLTLMYMKTTPPIGQFYFNSVLTQQTDTGHGNDAKLPLGTGGGVHLTGAFALSPRFQPTIAILTVTSSTCLMTCTSLLDQFHALDYKCHKHIV